MVSSAADVAVDHLNNWGALAWVLYYAGALLCAGVAMVGATWLELSPGSTIDYRSSGRAGTSTGEIVGCWAAGVIGSVIFWRLLSDITRHLASGRAVAAVLLVAALGAAYSWWRSFDRAGHLWTTVAAILSGAVGITAITEILTRLAASIPTTVPGLVLLLIIVGAAVRAWDN